MCSFDYKSCEHPLAAFFNGRTFYCIEARYWYNSEKAADSWFSIKGQEYELG